MLMLEYALNRFHKGFSFTNIYYHFNDYDTDVKDQYREPTKEQGQDCES